MAPGQILILDQRVGLYLDSIRVNHLYLARVQACHCREHELW